MTASVAVLAVIIGCGGSAAPPALATSGTTASGTSTTGSSTGTSNSGSTTGATGGGFTGLATLFPPNSIMYDDNGSSNYNVDTVQPDGSGIQTYLAYPKLGGNNYLSNGVFAPDPAIHNGLIFAQANDLYGDSYDLYFTVLNSKNVPGSAPVRLTYEKYGSIYNLQLSKDGSTIVIGAADQKLTPWVCTAAVDNSKNSPVIGTVKQLISGSYPYLGSDNTTIVYSEDYGPTKHDQIAAIKIDGSDHTVITTDPVGHMEPQFDPTMSRIVWVQDVDSNGSSDVREVWVYSMSSKTAVQATQMNTANMISACFSPDGATIAYCITYNSDASKNGIFTIPADSQLATTSTEILADPIIDSAIYWINVSGDGY